MGAQAFPLVERDAFLLVFMVLAALADTMYLHTTCSAT